MKDGSEDILIKKLEEKAERVGRESEARGIPIAKIKNAFEKFEDELKGLVEMSKSDVVSIRCNKAVKVMLDLIAEVMGVDKKDVLTFFAVKLFPEAWEKAPEPVKNYYEYKYPEIRKVHELLKGFGGGS